MNSNQEVLVTVQCLTYNHAMYIKQCLDGFLMQKTSFKFEVIVHDDASTDGTTEILKEYASKYPDIIKPIIEAENQYSKIGFSGIFTLMNQRSMGKYIAFCEGDDYWIDPLKLQKQADFLESHSEYVLVHTAWKAYNEKHKIETVNNSIEALNRKINNAYTPIDILKTGGLVLTLTVMTRKKELLEILSTKDFVFSPYFLMGDTQLWYSLRLKGKIQYLTDYTSMYRISYGTATRPNSYKKRIRFFLSACEMRFYLCNRDQLDKEYMKEVKKQYNRTLIKYLSLDTSFVPLYPLDLSNLNPIIHFLYKIGLYPIYIRLRNRYSL